MSNQGGNVVAFANEVIQPIETHCSICSDTYTSVVRKRVTCKYCTKTTCCKCIEQYLLTRMEDGHCIHCRVHYTDKDLQDICTKTYLKDKYFKHRQEILVNRERANLPALQMEANEEKRRRERDQALNAMAAEIKDMVEIRNNLRMEYINLSFLGEGHRGEMAEVAARMELSLNEINQKKEELYHLRIQPEFRLGRIGAAAPAAAAGVAVTEQKEEERRKFIRRCVRPNCNGFLSTAWKCGLCEWYSCSTCFTERGPAHDTPHECKKEDVETANLIRADSKPCPNCGEFINKSSGCDQMFCVSCQTPFSWTTLKIVTTGVIHNPHYYEMMKRKGQLPRNPGDVPCGGFPTMWQLVPHPRGVRSTLTDGYLEFHRLCQEVQDVSTRNYRSHIDNTITTGINVKYLLGDFTEAKWGQQLALNEKKRKRDGEIQEVFAAFLMVAVNIINTIQHYNDQGVTFSQLPVDIAEDMLIQLNIEIGELIAIMNDAFKGISVSYSHTVPWIQVRESAPNTPLVFQKIRYRLLTKHYKDMLPSKGKGAADSGAADSGAADSDGFDD